MRLAATLTAFVLVAVPAAAQNDSVTVNGDDQGQTLIDPATGQTRYVPALLQPWQDETIRLVPPGHHRRHKPAATATASTAASSAPTPASSLPEAPVAPAKPKHHTTVAVATPAPVAAAKPAPIRPAAKAPVGGMPDVDLITSTGSQPAAPAPKPAAAAPKPSRSASLDKPKSKAASGTRKDSISFAANATDPSGNAVAEVRGLASALSNSLGDSARVSLIAYAGAKGEKSSDASRLSLKRARVIRQILIDGGVPAERIDVYAMGGAEDDGAPDRVDIFLKG